MIEKIDPCPLCGGEAEVIPWSHGEAGRHDVVVRCKNCEFEGGPTDEADIALINWNERENIKSPHKPCPLCMGSPQIDEDGEGIFIMCSDCGAEVRVKIDVNLGENAWNEAAKLAWAKWDKRM